MKNTIKVDNLDNFQFWVGMFRPRTDKFKRETLKRLQNETGDPFAGTVSERDDKIKALKFLLQ